MVYGHAQCVTPEGNGQNGSFDILIIAVFFTYRPTRNAHKSSLVYLDIHYTYVGLYMCYMCGF